ncbi:uncharacterized protein A4U43_C04F27230 [Asparagus officinalis]|uniref:Uncharacterized protein n=1 Tax=Asparagus officinalis TaxID=4686 RepID=A0A5P1F8W7_ASPOF|nr:uncharacterized protein A4U43_C04F27230 [Asparagus officinalis]
MGCATSISELTPTIQSSLEMAPLTILASLAQPCVEAASPTSTIMLKISPSMSEVMASTPHTAQQVLTELATQVAQPTIPKGNHSFTPFFIMFDVVVSCLLNLSLSPLQKERRKEKNKSSLAIAKPL